MNQRDASPRQVGFNAVQHRGPSGESDAGDPSKVHTPVVCFHQPNLCLHELSMRSFVALPLHDCAVQLLAVRACAD